eukprot:1894939-Rhodomonas_salina.3
MGRISGTGMNFFELSANEQLTDFKVLKEVNRVLKPGGKVIIRYSRGKAQYKRPPSPRSILCFLCRIRARPRISNSSISLLKCANICFARSLHPISSPWRVLAWCRLLAYMSALAYMRAASRTGAFRPRPSRCG